MRAYTLTGTNPRLTLTERPDPTLGPDEVLVGLCAASLNYRDLLQSQLGLIPLSDGAGIVEALGDGTVGWSVGDPWPSASCRVGWKAP